MRAALAAMTSREMTELICWDRMKRGVKGPQDNAKAKAAIRAAMKAGFGGGKKRQRKSRTQ